jgi:hypothetical protein
MPRKNARKKAATSPSPSPSADSSGVVLTAAAGGGGGGSHHGPSNSDRVVVSGADGAQQEIAPVPVVKPEHTHQYRFPNPEGGRFCCTAWFSSLVLQLGFNVVVGLVGSFSAVLKMQLVWCAYAVYLLATQNTVPGMKHLAHLRYVDMRGQQVPCCCKLVAQGVLQFLFVAMFLVEFFGCCCDVERRPLSMQLLGLRFARIGATYKDPPDAAADTPRKAVKPILGATLAILVAAAAVAHSSGFPEWLGCYRSCAKSYGEGPGICTGLCDLKLKVKLQAWGVRL